MEDQLQLLLKVCSGELKEEEKEEYGITDEMLSGIQQACSFGYSAAQNKGLEEKIDNLTTLVTMLSEKIDKLSLSSCSSCPCVSNSSSEKRSEEIHKSMEDGNYSKYI